MFLRSQTRQVHVGSVAIGGGAAVSVQTMTTVHTHEIDATVAQINRLAGAGDGPARTGADIVRVAVPSKRDTAALPEILRQVRVPIVADVHFHFDRALEAVAAGVHKIRLNPGNIGDRGQVRRVIDACRERRIPIRIGVNEGSVVERKENVKRQADRQTPLVDLMVEKLSEYIHIFEDANFHDIVLAAKSHDARTVIDVYRRIAERWSYPLHLGVTHAGPPSTGTIRSAVALGSLLSAGLGDTIRVSFTADPILEVEAGREILYSLGLRRRTSPELIACPTCGRLQGDLLGLVEQVRPRLAELKFPMTVAIMGCVVNGPGEAEGTDVALCSAGERADIYRDGVKVRTVPRGQAVEALLQECRAWQDDRPHAKID
jgi:(E)-4-hydroxy-3-methylbut-2-enyl-diphosphate synthase